MRADVPQLLLTLEGISRHHPDRVLRLRGALPGADGGLEPFELLIFRGFSSSRSTAVSRRSVAQPSSTSGTATANSTPRRTSSQTKER